MGIEYASRQCEALIKFGVPGLHFYSLNKSYSLCSDLSESRSLILAAALQLIWLIVTPDSAGANERDMADSERYRRRRKRRAGRSPQAKARKTPRGAGSGLIPTISSRPIRSASDGRRQPKSSDEELHANAAADSAWPAGSWRSAAWAKPLSFIFRIGAAGCRSTPAKISLARMATACFRAWISAISSVCRAICFAPKPKS